MARIEYVAFSDGISVELADVSAYNGCDYIQVDWYLDGELTAQLPIEYRDHTHTAYYYFDGLRADTLYSIRATVYVYSSMSGGYAGMYNVPDSSDLDVWTSDGGGGGGGDDEPWARNSGTFQRDITGQVSKSVTITENTVNVRSISFVSSGNVNFNFAAGCPVEVYLVEYDYTWNNATGRPSSSSILASASTSNSFDTCEFNYNVQGGTDYRVFFRGATRQTSGAVVLTVTPGGGGGGGSDVGDGTWSCNRLSLATNISTTINQSLSLSAGVVQRYSMTFASSGEAVFSTSGSLDTYGFLSTDDIFNSSVGYPLNPIESDDDSGEDRNFSFTQNVTAGETYYLWVKAYDYSASGSITVTVVPPSGGGGTTSAYIEIDSTVGATWGLFRIKGLTASYNQNPKRTLTWFYKANGELNWRTFTSEELPNLISTYGDRRITSLQPSTTYKVYAVISGIVGTNDVSLAEVSFTTANVEFNMASMSFGTVQNSKNVSALLKAYGDNVIKVEITFAVKGNAVLYSSNIGSVDPYAYLSSVSGWDAAYRYPQGNSYIAKNDDNNGSLSFEISSSVEAGTYYLWIRTAGVTSNSSATISINVDFTPNAGRPDSFSWAVPKYSVYGGVECNFEITAVEWNDFLDYINDLEEYKGRTKTAFTRASEGGYMTAAMFNQTQTALNNMGVAQSSLYMNRDADTECTAEMLNAIVTLANGIN